MGCAGLPAPHHESPERRPEGPPLAMGQPHFSGRLHEQFIRIQHPPWASDAYPSVAEVASPSENHVAHPVHWEADQPPHSLYGQHIRITSLYRAYQAQPFGQIHHRARTSANRRIPQKTGRRGVGRLNCEQRHDAADACRVDREFLAAKAERQVFSRMKLLGFHTGLIGPERRIVISSPRRNRTQLPP